MMGQLLIWLMVLVSCGQRIIAQTAVPSAAGEGSQANPYQVATPRNLCRIASDATHWEYFFGRL